MGFSRQEYWRGMPLPSPLLRYTWQIELVLLRCTTWCLDIHIHCEMISMVKLINTTIISDIPLLLPSFFPSLHPSHPFSLFLHLCFTFLVNFKYPIQSCSLTSMCYTLDLHNLLFLFNWDFLYFWRIRPHFPLHLASGNHPSNLCEDVASLKHQIVGLSKAPPCLHMTLCENSHITDMGSNVSQWGIPQCIKVELLEEKKSYHLSLICSFSKYLLSSCTIPGIVLSHGNSAVNKTNMVSILMAFIF